MTMKENERCEISWCTCERSKLLSDHVGTTKQLNSSELTTHSPEHRLIRHHLGQTEIRHFTNWRATLRQEQVFRFEISVGDASGVQV